VITVQLNTTQTARAMRRLTAKAPAAIARAVNRSAASGKTVMVRIVAKDMGLKQAYIRERIAIVPAQPGVRPVALITARKKPIPLIAFGARGPVPSRGQGRGVTARNPGGAGRYPHAFIAKVRYPAKGGEGLHVGVFERKQGAKRRGPKPHRSQLPIRQLYGPSVAHVAVKQAAPAALARALEQLEKNLRHELRFALSKSA
jgi:hypothetical protein